MMLYKYIKIQIAKDNTRDRKNYIKSYLAKNYVSYVFYHFINLTRVGKSIANLSWCATRFAPNIPVNSARNGVFLNTNEQSALLQLKEDFDFKSLLLISLASFKSRINSIKTLFSIVSKIPLLKIWSLSKLLSKRYPFYISARCLEIISLYLYFKFIRNDLHQKWFFISTESNPHSLALMALAEEHILHVVFVTHSPFIDNASPIFVDIGIFWNSYTKNQIVQRGGKVNSFYIHRRDSLINTQKKKDSILISLSKNPDWSGVLTIVKQIKDSPVLGKYLIKVRLHPSDIIPPKPDGSDFRLSRNKSLQEDLASSVLMIAGNSTVHLESLKAKVPSFYTSKVDFTKNTTLPFILNKDICPLSRLWNQRDLDFEIFYPENKNKPLINTYFSPIDDHMRQDLKWLIH